jgi:hypothetical protein
MLPRRGATSRRGRGKGQAGDRPRRATLTVPTEPPHSAVQVRRAVGTARDVAVGWPPRSGIRDLADTLRRAAVSDQDAGPLGTGDSDIGAPDEGCGVPCSRDSVQERQDLRCLRVEPMVPAFQPGLVLQPQQPSGSPWLLALAGSAVERGLSPSPVPGRRAQREQGNRARFEWWVTKGSHFVKHDGCRPASLRRSLSTKVNRRAECRSTEE